MTLYEEALLMLDEAKRRIVAQSITDDAIIELVEEAIKRLQADHDALVFEAVEMARLTGPALTEANNAKIRDRAHNQTVTWDWRRHGNA